LEHDTGYFFYLCPAKNFKKMIENSDKGCAGDVPATADNTAATAGTFGNCCRAGALLLKRRSPETTPGDTMAKQRIIKTTILKYGFFDKCAL
jgi:hypothetical protein